MIVFPETFQLLLGILKVLNFDVIPSLRLQCSFGNFDYTEKMVLQTLGPLGVVALLWIAFLFERSKSTKVLTDLKKRAETYDAGALESAFEPKELTLYKITFSMFDLDGGGTVDKDEFSAVLQSFNPEKSQEEVVLEVASVFAQVDERHSGNIDFIEFLISLHRVRKQGKGSSAFTDLIGKVEAEINRTAGGGIMYAILLISFVVLVGTSTTIFHFLKV
jgi:hypothetical protein